MPAASAPGHGVISPGFPANLIGTIRFIPKTKRVENSKLPPVQTRKQFMDCLEDAMSGDDVGGYAPVLKAYVLESEGGFPAGFSSVDMDGEVQSTGLDDIRIFRVRRNGEVFEFFPDTSDPRFFALHTVERFEAVSPIIKTFIKDH